MTEASAPSSTTPPSNDTPFVSDLMRLLRVPFSPGAVFAEVQDRPTFWRPWLIVGLISAIVSYLQRPFQQQIARVFLERAGRTMPPDTPVKSLLSACGAPVLVLIMAFISAVILYALVSMMGGQTTLKKMMNVVIFAWPIVLLTQIITVAVLMSRGVASIQSPTDMIVSLGLDLLVPSDANLGYFMRFFLAGIGPLQIWGLVITAVGLQIMGKASKGSAWTAAIIHFLIVLTCIAGLAAFGMKMAAGATGGQ